jgi:exonuclease III
LEKKFKLKGYNFIHNSKGSSRGVGILLKSTLIYTIHSKTYDFDDNYILLDISIDNYRFVLGCVYGPNRDENEFFDNLKLDVRNLNQKSIIIGGDWNATHDSNPVPNNIDVINMVSIPSRRRSLQICSIARSRNLIDPYRFFNP